MKKRKPVLPANWRKTYVWVRSGRVRKGDVLRIMDGYYRVANAGDEMALRAEEATFMVFRALGGGS